MRSPQFHHKEIRHCGTALCSGSKKINQIYYRSPQAVAILFLCFPKLELAEFDMNQICQELKSDTWALMSDWGRGVGW